MIRPMQGVRMLEVAQFTFTPAAGGVLADWGADVIKVEHPVTGDAQRSLRGGPHGQIDGRWQPIIEHPNRGKRSIGLDLGQPDGRAILLELAASSDIFLTNFLPEARRRLGIEVEDLRSANPQIIYVRGSAFGPKGAESENGGYDASAFWGRAGSAFGVTPEDAPRLLGMPAPAYGDSMGGMTIAGGIAAALFARAQTGQPSVVDVSLLSVGAWAMGLSVDTSLMTNTPFPAAYQLEPAVTNPLAGQYRTADGRWLVLTMLQPGKYWADLCAHLDRSDLAEDPRFWPVEQLMANAAEAAEVLREVFLTRTYSEWIERFTTLEGQWAPVQNALELGNDPQLLANGLIAEIDDADGKPRKLVASPVLFDETAAEIQRGPLFAEHTDEILRELGRDDDELIKLKIDGVIT